MAGAMVMLRDEGADNDEPAGIGVTSESGTFELHARPGVFRVIVDADGYALGTREVTAPAQNVKLLLAPASSISGKVTFRDGHAVDGSKVSITREMGDGYAGQTITGTDGTFDFNRLPPGGYKLVALGASHRSGVHRVIVGPAETVDSIELKVISGAKFTASVTIENEACESGHVDLVGPIPSSATVDADGTATFFALLPGVYRATINCAAGLPLVESIDINTSADQRATWTVSRSASIHGFVRSARGRAAANISMRLDDVQRGRSLECSLSNADGQFRCLGVPPGTYECYAEHLGRAISSKERVHVNGHDPLVEVTLSTAAELVVDVRDDAGHVSDDATLVLYGEGQQYENPRRVSPGKFVFDHLPVGEYKLAVAGDPTRLDVRLRHDGDVAKVVIVEPARSPIGGKVLDERGEPVRDAWVRIKRVDFAVNEQDASMMQGLSGDDGLFKIADVPVGVYTVSASTSLARSEAKNVRAGDGAVAIELREFASLSGRVTNRYGEASRNFILSYVDGSGTGESESIVDLSGEWFLPWLPPGKLRINIAVGQQIVSRETHVVSGRNKPLLIELP